MQIANSKFTRHFGLINFQLVISLAATFATNIRNDWLSFVGAGAVPNLFAL